jgi:hypothetical protein
VQRLESGQNGPSASPPHVYGIDAGVDSFKLRWRLSPRGDSVASLFRQTGLASYTAQGVKLRHDRDDVWRFGCVGDMVWAEGRLGSVCDGMTSSLRLGRASELHVADGKARAALCGYGIDVGDAETMVGRLDLAADVTVSDPFLGLAFLTAVAAATPRRYKTDCRYGQGYGPIQTVYWRTARRGGIRLRAYDKGVKEASVGLGRHVRVEVQTHFAKASECSLSTVAVEDLSRRYLIRVAPLMKANQALLVAGGDAAMAVVSAGLVAGQISVREAEKLFGTIHMVQQHGWGAWSAKTSQRRRKSLLEAGLLLDAQSSRSGGVATTTVPIRLVTRELALAWQRAG